ncbi:MAG: tetratricopeptide repeat protein [Pseudomonadota bacterium]
MIPLEPKDIRIFKQYIKKDLERILGIEVALLLPERQGDSSRKRPMPEMESEEFVGPIPVKDIYTDLVLLPLTSNREPIGVAGFRDTAGILARYGLKGRWHSMNELVLEKVQLYKTSLMDKEWGCLTRKCLEDLVICWINEQRDSLDGENGKPGFQKVIYDPDQTLDLIFVEEFPGPLSPFRTGKDREARQGDDFWPKMIPSIMKTAGADSCLFRLDESLLAVIPAHDARESKACETGKAIFEALKRTTGGRSASHLGKKFAMGLLSLSSQKMGDWNGLTPDEAYDRVIDNGRRILNIAKSRHYYPFAISNELEEEEKLTLINVIHPVLGELAARWQKSKQFSLILAKYDEEIEADMNRAVQAGVNDRFLKGECIIPCGLNSFFVLFPGISPDVALERVRDIQCFVKEYSGQTVSIGLVAYPLKGYEKEEIPFNAHKALIHAGFFGPDTITAFDEVSLNISGDMLFNAGHLHAAIIEYEKGIQLGPDNLNLLNSLRVCHAQLKQYKQAIPCFEKALNMNENDLMARYNLASVYSKSFMPERAISLLREASALNEDHFETFFQLGRLLQEKKNWAEALEAFKKAAECADAKGIVHRYLGESCLALDLRQEAMTEFKKAVKINPADAFSLSRLGILFAEVKNDYEIAHALSSKAIELDENNSSCLKAAGWISFLKKDYSEAIRSLEKARQFGKKDPEVFYQLGMVYQEMKKANQARKNWEKALRIDPYYTKAEEALRTCH